ncbi:RAD55 family ATPase [Methanolobus halotolerans]|uniref:Resolvase n=1 Tax=Methanolobus halotolerans TaxID=2052935 RepID=A0A4E0Q2B0_9EURY|nr:RAD55 family ATPase [Methanolobus halotolerans]TGC11379.1 resolvase [Methanolobus halotolerans]
MPVKRVSTGISELDDLLDRGYPKGHGILISGPPGAGKTILATHFLHQSCKDGKKCMLMLTHVNVESFLEQAENIGFDFKRCLDNGTLLITKSFEVRTNKIHNASRLGSGIGFVEKDCVENVQEIPDDVEIVVIDNLDMLSLYHSVEEFADKFFTINDILSSKRCTTLFLIGQEESDIKHRVAEHISFGSIMLYTNRNGRKGKGLRQLYIPKMRCTDLSLEPTSFRITPSGIKIEKIFQRDDILREALGSAV